MCSGVTCGHASASPCSDTDIVHGRALSGRQVVRAVPFVASHLPDHDSDLDPISFVVRGLLIQEFRVFWSSVGLLTLKPDTADTLALSAKRHFASIKDRPFNANSGGSAHAHRQASRPSFESCLSDLIRRGCVDRGTCGQQCAEDCHVTTCRCCVHGRVSAPRCCL